tara:strand:- start:418 stop:570 length:153 start_codon:yes stop_codon:yes gene_type:complete
MKARDDRTEKEVQTILVQYSAGATVRLSVKLADHVHDDEGERQRSETGEG